MKYFPLGLAEGKAFCNRVAERKKLKINIESNRSTIVISPRRYGKSSLVLYVLDQLKIPYKRVDLFVALDEATVSREIIDGVNTLLNQIVNTPEKMVVMMKDILKNVSTKWSVGTDGVSVELSRKFQKDDALAIRDALHILDRFLEQKKQKAIFFIDEFQEIGVIANAKGIEGAIRTVAEKSKNLIFIFSGSNRHVLSTMFDDRSRPLYMLCDRITLERISEDDYVSFINKIAVEKWGSELSQSFYKQLFTTTELHPYYVNLLCGRLYTFKDAIPTENDIKQVWHQCLLEEKSKTAMELSKLSLIQKKVLISIANAQHGNLTSKETLKRINASSGAIVKGIKTLISKDYVFEHATEGYQVVDPLIKSSIQTFFHQDELI
jgi:AAA+ ATPase superfamily predicted ATPase